MAITNGYATLAEIRARLAISDPVDIGQDTMLERMVEAASRAIDSDTGQSFYAATATRYFRAQSATRLALGCRLLSITTLKCDQDGDRTYEETWAATDYDLMPQASAHASVGYTWIDTAPAGRYYFPVGRNPRSVEIAGTWGYAATTPPAVHEACCLIAEQLFLRKDAALGTQGAAGFIHEARRVLWDDPHIAGLLRVYRRII